MTEPNTEAGSKSLKDTAWLARRLNLSITTIERFRVKAPKLLPPAIKLGNSIRYDEDIVEAWVKRKAYFDDVPPIANGAEQTEHPNVAGGSGVL